MSVAAHGSLSFHRHITFYSPLPKRHPNIVRHTTADRLASIDPGVQSLLARFDRDGDGQLTYAEAKEAFAALQAAIVAADVAPVHSNPAAAPPPVAPTAAIPLTWDLQVLHGTRGALSQGRSPLAALLAFMATKLSNTGKARAAASDLLWSFMGMFLSVTALGVMNLHVRSWPVVGEWHQQGLGLLLGSFGTLCVLIFGRPEAEAVRVWNLLAGHVIATATVLSLLHVLGPSILSRALAMASMITCMLWTDSVHPPGGALVLMAVDSTAIQRMDWWFMLYPSLAVTIALLLPLGVLVNWLKRNVRFDFPTSSSSSSNTPAAAAAAASSASASAAVPQVTFSDPSQPPSDLRPKLA